MVQKQFLNHINATGALSSTLHLLPPRGGPGTVWVPPTINLSPSYHCSLTVGLRAMQFLNSTSSYAIDPVPTSTSIHYYFLILLSLFCLHPLVTSSQNTNKFKIKEHWETSSLHSTLLILIVFLPLSFLLVLPDCFYSVVWPYFSYFMTLGFIIKIFNYDNVLCI